MPIDATPTSFEQDVVERSRTTPVLVDFWASWCGPCRIVGPVLEELERELGRFTLVKVDVEKHHELGQRFHVSGIPAMKLFVGGRVVGEQVGALPKGVLRDWLEQLIPGAEVEHAATGERALAAGDLDGAERAFRDALALRPGFAPGSVGLARVLAARGETREAWRLVADLRGREGAAARLAVAAAEADPAAEGTEGKLGRALRDAVEGRAEAAIDGLLDIVRTDRRHGDDAARKRLLDLIEALDRPELAADARKRLTFVLY